MRVLIVEDEAIVLMQLEAMVEDLGHSVVATAMSANEAMIAIAATRPELVLLDLHLNDGSSGLEVAQAVCGMDGVTVVFITANGLKLADDIRGAAGVIVKPFNARILEKSLAYMEECIHRPPPTSDVPYGFKPFLWYLSKLAPVD